MSIKLVIDLGGTNCKLAIANDGQLGGITIIETSKQPQELVKAILETVQDWDFAEIKVAAAGHWNQEQLLVQSHNLANYIGYPIWQELSQKLNCKIELFNDMQVAAIGEAIIGQNNQYQNLVYLNLGTGIGASYFDGKKVMSQDYSPCLRLDLRPKPKGIFYSKSESQADSIESLQSELINLAIMLAPEIITIGGGKAKEHWASIVEPAIKSSLEYLNKNLSYQIKIEKAKLEYPALYGISI